MRYIFDKMDGNVKFVTRQVKHLLDVDYLVKFDEYVGYEKFYIAVTFVDEELQLYMKVSLAIDGSLWVDIHPRGWY